MATTTQRKAPGASAAQLAAVLAKSDIASSISNKQVISDMAKLISGMGVSVPKRMTPPAPMNTIKSAPLPKLSNLDSILLTLITNQNEWFLVLAGTTKRQASKRFRKLGPAIEVATRINDSGTVDHYARYTGAEFSDEGKVRMAKLTEKLTIIQKAASDGVTRRSTTGTLNGPASLTHAVKYPLNKTERTFLDVVARPNEQILVRENATSNDEFFTFRWKWSRRYGFDLSQFTISQRRQDNGMYNIYAQYTPNADGTMNSSMREFVEFLHKKPLIPNPNLGRKAWKTTDIQVIKNDAQESVKL
jgi:hypothetical protein